MNDAEMWKLMGRQSVSQLEIWTRSAPENFANKLHLLIAEDLSISSSGHETTLDSYNESIRLARRYHLVHEEALASERAGLYCVDKLLFSEGIKYISHAYSMYEKWGCKSKLDHLKSTVGLYIKDSTEVCLDIFHQENSQDFYVNLSSSQSSLS